ncbi:four helix bundle protein [Ekhidna sp.]|uniref:four helix bundle protein n=1 Tax=Ekhidna sp. TaxID=2608089 RepID=UPI0032EE00C1
MNNFRELKVWQRAIDLATLIYSLTKSFPESEKYGLTSQLQRAAISVSSNIAEGSGRQTKPDFKHFLSIALGSLYEIESQLVVSQKLNYISEEAVNTAISEVTEIQKMIYSLRSKL